MAVKSVVSNIVEFHLSEYTAQCSDSVFLNVELIAFAQNGRLHVRSLDNQEFHCDWLENSNNANIDLEPGDRLLCMSPTGQEPGVVLGRIGKYRKPQTQEHVTIEAGESLTLKCGEASVELRNDGRAMVKGEDVLLRAKGTQRIRAANVAIN